MSPIDRRTMLAGLGGMALGGAGVAGGSAPALAAPDRRHHDRIASVAYIEVNNNSLLNAGRYVLDDGAAAFSIAVIFAANINYDGSRAYLHFNDNVQHVLDNADTYVRPLQEMGIKVVLSILGNHQGAGLANFPDRRAADRFAREVSTAVRRYGLDGVDLDDEWAEYGAGGTGPPNEHSFVHVVASLRKRLPNRIITFYVIGPSAERQVYGDQRVGDLIDHAWNPYYGTFQDFDVPGLARSDYGAAAVDLRPASDTTTEMVRTFAETTVDEGYGAFVTYQLPSDDESELVSAWTGPLYGSPAHFR